MKYVQIEQETLRFLNVFAFKFGLFHLKIKMYIVEDLMFLSVS